MLSDLIMSGQKVVFVDSKLLVTLKRYKLEPNTLIKWYISEFPDDQKLPVLTQT